MHTKETPIKISKIVEAYKEIDLFNSTTAEEYFSQPISDHALIRYEFDDYIIYSWNILNHLDAQAIPITLKHFSATSILTVPEMLDEFGNPKWTLELIEDLSVPWNRKYYRELCSEKMMKFDIPPFGKKQSKLDEIKEKREGKYYSVGELLDIFNKIKDVRLDNIIYLLREKIDSEEKPVIVCLQEIHPTMVDKISDAFSDTHTIHTSDKDVLNFPVTKLSSKDELRLTLVPKEFQVLNSASINFNNSPHIPTNVTDRKDVPESVIRAFKPALLTSVKINGINCDIVNVHAFFMSQDVNLREFLESLRNDNTTIIVGDFNRDIKFASKSIIGEYSIASPGSTFITKHINSSDELDHLMHFVNSN